MDMLNHLLDSVKGYGAAVGAGLLSAFGLWAFLVLANAMLTGFGAGLHPAVAGVVFGADYWGVAGIFVAIAVLVDLIVSRVRSH